MPITTLMKCEQVLDKLELSSKPVSYSVGCEAKGIQHTGGVRVGIFENIDIHVFSCFMAYYFISR